MRDNRWCLSLVFFAGLLTPLTATAAETPAGLVESVTGETTPRLSEMAAIPANTAIRLAPETALTFVHFKLCQSVTVTGGTVTLSDTDFTTDGHIDNRQAVACPTIHQLGSASAGASSGGIVVRGISLLPLPVEPEIVFVGSRAPRVVAASILREGGEPQPIVSFAVAGPRATLPKGSPPLTPNSRYVLRVAFSDESSLVDLPFIARAASTTSSLVVLRVD
jgi:hypothetical protein